MADTTVNIKLTKNTWIDLYAASGIAIGVQILVRNLSSVEAKLHTSATTPTATDATSDESGSFSTLKSYQSSVNDSGDSGLWAYSHSDGLVNVTVATSISGYGNSDLEYGINIQLGRVPGISYVHKYGRNPDVDTAAGFVAVWNGGGDYTGHNCVVAELLATTSSSTADAGTLVSSGSATGGSKTSLVDSGATFVSDGVIVGAVLINDTKLDHAIVTAVTETTLSFLTTMKALTIDGTNAYRIAIKASTGAPVLHISALLDGNLANETSEYIILNGQAAVDTVGSYRRHSRAKVHGGDSIGIITTNQKVTTANVTMVLPVGYNSTMIAAYTIPAGKKGLFNTWFAGKAKKQASFSNVRLMIRPVNDVYQVAEEVTVASTGTSAVIRDFHVPKDGLAPMTDIKVMADTDTDNNGVAAGFDITLLDT